MTKGFRGDPLEELRRVDPLHPGEVPPDASGKRARALFLEVASMDTIERPAQAPAPAPRRRQFTMALAGAAAVVVVAVAGVALTHDGGTDPVVGGEPVGNAAAMCAEMYDLNTVAGRDIAFDGTVTAIDGDRVTFEVGEWFTGGSGDTVTLDAAGLTGPETSISIGGPVLQTGGRYLVSGSDGFVWACGFTMTYDTEIARQWADVFGG